MSRDIDRLLLQTHRDAVLRYENLYLSKSTNVEVFEAGLKGARRERMDDKAFTSFLKGGGNLLQEEVRFRAVFVPDKETDTDKLQLSPTAFGLLLDRFDICSRFAGLIHMQMQPSRNLEYDQKTRKLKRIQYLYSAIRRSLNAAPNPKDPTKRLLDWRRFVVWTGRDMQTGVTTMVILRCASDDQERFIGSFGDGAEGQRQLLRHPMLAHAFFAESLVVQSSYFSGDFAAPMYGLELDLGRTASEYTHRSRRFMLMARQMGNVLIDHDIYLASLKLLIDISKLLRHSDVSGNMGQGEWRDLHFEFDDVQTFEQVQADFELLRRYGKLYEQRTMIGHNECTTLVNQREIEISKSMSAESTVIARSSHRDGQSLQIIQYLGLVFLPLSLCTSIFGMGFFTVNYDPTNASKTVFLVSNTWWWFLALSVPFTMVVVAVAFGIATWSRRQVDQRRRSDMTELEQLLAYEMTTHEHQSEEFVAP